MSANYVTRTNINASTITTVTLNATGVSTISIANILGNLQISGISGSVGQTIVKTSATTQAWGQVPVNGITAGANDQWLVTSSGVAQWVNGTNRYLYNALQFSTQNWNSAAVTSLTFASASASVLKFGTTNITNITLTGGPPATAFTINTAGFYNFELTGALSNAAVGTSQVFFRMIVNGVNLPRLIYCSIIPTGTTGFNAISGSISVSLNAGDVIQLRSVRSTGTGTLTCTSGNTFLYVTLLNTVIAT